VSRRCPKPLRLALLGKKLGSDYQLRFISTSGNALISFSPVGPRRLVKTLIDEDNVKEYHPDLAHRLLDSFLTLT